MLMIRDGLQQAKNMLTRFGIKPVQQHRIGRAIFRRHLERRIIHDHIAIILHSQFRSHLQHNLHPLSARRHGILPQNFQPPHS